MCGIYNINYRRYFAVPFVSDKKREEFLNDVKKTVIMKQKISYKDAGVDIEKADQAIDSSKKVF